MVNDRVNDSGKPYGKPLGQEAGRQPCCRYEIWLIQQCSLLLGVGWNQTLGYAVVNLTLSDEKSNALHNMKSLLPTLRRTAASHGETWTQEEGNSPTHQ